MIVVDTGVLVAAINQRDMFHESCARFLVTAAEPWSFPRWLSPRFVTCLRGGGRGTPHLAAAFLEPLAAGELDVEAPTAAVLRYHGDFDAAGLAMAARACHAGCTPFRMSAADYRVAVAAAHATT
ncbi:DUF2399 domain-containing protein [Frankia sp. R82]|uniref:DUF2399 domain-containing protein n=1 Tax=Frankia sp. R82 TaxID=2950553 RepID=UPI002043A2C5|nr:DUF2399 domain-containing protein [Frankia sp. R82]MCM3886157.1 DUF2399 domain-containing protein [Frankia sp. R82]